MEKWIALVRFRKAVNAHAAEVGRLESLLKIAQGGAERSRLTSELELVTSRYSLEDMEEALHKEVYGWSNTPCQINLSILHDCEIRRGTSRSCNRDANPRSASFVVSADFDHVQHSFPYAGPSLPNRRRQPSQVSTALSRSTRLPNKRQVAALKQGATGQTDGGTARTSVVSIDVAAWEEKLDQSRTEQKDASEKQIADLEENHQRAVEV